MCKPLQARVKYGGLHALDQRIWTRPLIRYFLACPENRPETGSVISSVGAPDQDPPTAQTDATNHHPFPMPTKNGGVSKLAPSATERHNRKIAQASRTLKACDLCRRQKTRCFRAPDDPALCLRCSFLGATCSFAYANLETGLPKSGAGPDMSKLDAIWGAVSELLRIAKTLAHVGSASLMPSAPLPLIDDSANFEDLSSQQIFAIDSDAAAAAPFRLASSVFALGPVPRAVAHITNSVSCSASFDHQDPVCLGLITEKQAVNLVAEFRRNYSRWISIPAESTTESVVSYFRRSLPLLLSVCCCLSLRCVLVFKDGDGGKLARERAQFFDLLSHVVKLLGDSISQFSMFGTCHQSSGALEALQSLVVVSLYSISLTTMANVGFDLTCKSSPSISTSALRTLNLDAWQLSATALTTFVTKSSFGSLYHDELSTMPVTDMCYPPLKIMRIYNHLCLVHLVNCLFLGRMCVLDETRLNHCLSTLGLPSATNFDGRMVAEIGIIRIAYTFAQAAGRIPNSDRDQQALFNETLALIAQWHLQWEHLFNQPGIQFVEMQFNFCCMLVRFTSSYHRARDSTMPVPGFPITGPDTFLTRVLSSTDPLLLDEIIEHAALAVKHVQSIDNDAYFAYLLDQIHYSYYFCATVLLSLLAFSNLDVAAKARHVDDVVVLRQKFHTVAHGSKLSVLQEYAQNLQQALQRTFPERFI